MDDKIYNEIKKKADIQFKEYLELFNEGGNDKDYDKFITLIFKDIIKVDIVNNRTEYIQIIDNPNYCSSFFDIYNEKLKYIQSNNSSIFLEKIKELIQQQNKTLLKKIVECKDHLEIIKKCYINLILSEKTSFNDTSELSFKSKSVLTSNNNLENLEIGEVFTRYMFYLIGDKTKITSSSKIGGFYNNLFSFIDIPSLRINNFKNWSFQVQNFILIIFLINLLFNSTSNYSDIFNENKIKANINELKKLEVQKKNNKKDKKDKNKKKQKGGGKKDKSKKEKPRTDAGYLATILNNPSKKNNQQQSKKNNKSQKKTNTKTNSSNLKKKIIESLKQVSLYKIYYSEFEDEIIKYFKEYIKVNICNIPGTTDFPISIKVPIFDNKEINLKEFYSKIHKNLTGKQNITRLGCADKTGIDSLFSGFKFDIFQTLIAFDNSDNFKDLFDISKKIKEKVIFLLFTLYSRKKYLYEEYINSCSRIFQIEVKENNKSTNNKKTNNKSSIQKNKEPVMANYENKIKKNKDIQNKKELIILQKFNSKQKNDYIKIKHTLNLLSKRMKELETSGYNDNQNDIKKLKYEKMYHNLIIRQRQLVSSISSF
jgi:hypothetical protein